MSQHEPNQWAETLRRAVIVVFLLVWACAVLLYSLWPARPSFDVNHEAALGLATLCLGAGLASLLLIGRHRLQLGVGIVLVLVGSGFILEQVQGRFVEAARNETSDVVVIALGAVGGVCIAWLLATIVGPIWCQRIVAVALIGGATVTVAIPTLHAPAVAQWWNCDRPGAPGTSQPLFELDRIDLTGEAVTFDDTDSIYCGLPDSSAFTLSFRARTADLNQDGPARLVTLSTGIDTDQIDFQVGQAGTGLSVRLRTAARFYDQLVVDGVFADTDWHDYIVRFDTGTLTASVDGEPVGTLATTGTTLSGWDERWPLTFGNEVSGDRPFTGTIENILLVSDTNGQGD